jgi:Carboxypeptidase regulatory-like domain
MLDLPRCNSVVVSLCLKTPIVAMLVALLCFAALCPASLHAQSVSGTSIAGVVTDSSGAVVVGATVKLTDKATHTPRTASTNDVGRYYFAEVASGDYEINVSKPGFRVTKTVVTANIGAPLTVDLKLELGSVSETVEVTASNASLQTMNATVGNTVTATALDALPSLNRDISTFVELQPGVSPDGSVAGAVVDQSTFMLDGGNNTNDMDGSMSVYTKSFAGDPTGVSNQSFAVAAGPTGVLPTPADSVEEFKVNSAGQTADFNSSSGAQVEVVTRRGSDAVHGSVYEYYLDNNFSANTWDNNASKTALPDWHRSRFGARAGGPVIPKKILGGKTYIFGNYEGYRWPNTATVERAVPSADMRLGLLTFGGVTYNLNNSPVTSAEGVTYAANAGCGGSPCDPRGLGINPLVQQVWNKLMPLSNESACGLGRCDGVNVQGFKANVAIPQTSDFGVLRLDHDFGDKWHFMASYRYFKLINASTDQVDIGGFFPGDKLGVPASRSSNPQLPWYYVLGLTTNITSNTTNSFHYSFLRNWWAWGRSGDTVQLAGLGGALEPFGETATQALIPYNVNTQQTRTRFWDGHDQMVRDDISILKGSHLFQFGGTYQHNWNYHQRTDNGGGINYQPVYQLGTTAGAGIDVSSLPADLQTKTGGRDYAAVLGIVSISQQAYTRTGANLALNPPLTPASDKSTIPYYNVYWSDSWRIKPTVTLNYGLGWTLEMPPVEESGKQVELVDQANRLVDVQAYLHSREQAALQGQVYNPIVGFNLVGNSENGRKYPYDPFYGSFSPRISVAWNPHFSGGFLNSIFGQDQSVIRGGYNRIYGRLNGVDLVLVPLLGTGLIQPVQCIGALNAAAAAANGGNPCGGTSGANPTTAFRVGTDGLTAPIQAATPTLPQPLFPGVNGVSAGAGEALDPHFRPNVIDSFDFTIQRQVTRNFLVELGYIGRRITHEYQPININAVPYMMTIGGQRFDKAYANVEVALGCAISTNACGANIPAAKLANGTANPAFAAYFNALTPQPFFETALAGTGYCNGFASCTAAMAFNENSNLTSQNVWSLWSDLDQGGATCSKTQACGFNFARTMLNSPLNCPTGAEIGCGGQLSSGVGVNASIGYGNYNAAFFSFKANDWHGVTAQSNFTWSRALSTGAVVQATSADTADDPYNLRRGYGLAGFDRKFVYNLFIVYQDPFYKSQQGLVGHLLGGWTFGPIFTAGSGLPITLGTLNGGGQSFGEGDSVNFFGNGNSENAVIVKSIPAAGVHYGVPGSNGIGTSGFGVNLFANPEAVYNSIRQPILGLDNGDGGWGVLRGLPYWSLDLSIAKSIKLTERFNLQATAVFINVLNHVVFTDPGPSPAPFPGDYLDTSSTGSWGVLPGQANTPRTMEFGIRVNF